MSNPLNIPPMPQPSEFGIDDNAWFDYSQRDEGPSAGTEKVKAYYAALEAWKEMVKLFSK